MYNWGPQLSLQPACDNNSVAYHGGEMAVGDFNISEKFWYKILTFLRNFDMIIGLRIEPSEKKLILSFILEGSVIDQNQKNLIQLDYCSIC